MTGFIDVHICTPDHASFKKYIEIQQTFRTIMIFCYDTNAEGDKRTTQNYSHRIDLAAYRL